MSRRTDWAGTRSRARLLAFASVLGLAVACIALVLYMRAGNAHLMSSGTAPGEISAEPADWCAAGYEPIEGGGCFAFPTTEPRRALIVYLHGRYARDAAADEVDRQRRLASRATSRGFAVLALRGRLGTCTAPELADWFCWPSNERNADAGSAFVNSWARALSAAQERVRAGKRYLLGFSNGGYFAALIASRGLLGADAVVVAHAGPVEPVRPTGGMAPLLLLSADDDISQDEMIRLDDELTRIHWAHDSYARFGGHALTDEDIDAALTFFARAQEPLPLKPPLPLHRPVAHSRDAGFADGSQGAWTTPPEDDAEPESSLDNADEQPSRASDDDL